MQNLLQNRTSARRNPKDIPWQTGAHAAGASRRGWGCWPSLLRERVDRYERGDWPALLASLRGTPLTGEGDALLKRRGSASCLVRKGEVSRKCAALAPGDAATWASLGKCISLLDAFRLADVTASTGIIPLAIHRCLLVEQAQTAVVQGDLAKFAEEGGPGDRVVRIAAVQRNHGHVQTLSGSVSSATTRRPYRTAC